jgi:hypothetical protein
MLVRSAAFTIRSLRFAMAQSALGIARSSRSEAVRAADPAATAARRKSCMERFR